MSTTPQTRTAVEVSAAEESDLPEGWARAKLGEVSNARLGKTPSRNQYRDEGAHRVIKFRDLTENGIDYSRSKAGYVENSAKALTGLRPVHTGDVLVTASAHSGDQIGKKCAFVGHLPAARGNVYFVGELLGITSDPHVMSAKWPFYWFLSDAGVEVIQAAVAGVHLTAGRAQQMPFPIAPLPEQERIISKLDALLIQINAARERLAKVPKILKRFRQSVLAAACSGRLTEDWSRENRLPDWQYTSLAQASVQIQIGPFGTQLHRHDYVEGGIPLINPMHIKEGEIFPTPDCTVSRAKAAELAQYRMRTGDVILARRGEMGRAAVVGGAADGYLCGTGSLFIRPSGGKIDSHFLSFVLRSPQAKAALEGSAVGSTMTNLNQGIVGELEFPEVDIQEQHEIVRRVEALFKQADMIEKRVEGATKRAEKLTQAILAKAFRGELVPTEAELARREGHDYEPASALLARIRAEREAKEIAASRNRKPQFREKT